MSDYGIIEKLGNFLKQQDDWVSSCSLAHVAGFSIKDEKVEETEFDVQSVRCRSGDRAGQYHVLFKLFSKCLLRRGIAHYGEHHFPATWVCFEAI